ncbi:glycoside hydrolase family 108 protein [Devosia aurantiaca]|uniref:Glycoside hydrolase family 108 protein n=1 Tax=Devosia aurantiaca TaxID=2714858 RepID=A0A6M1SUZ7_9HYPH|nr:glycoside hydrolase family 108 protein [Devosia aurantiaca]NGP18935.1 glycoside hydrolase family 108 protein [Devosia aurantiaca]
MAEKNFAAALPAVLAHEGGYVDHPSDPGGATNLGITRKTLARWRNISPWTSLPKSAVKALSRDEAAAIYKDRYWDDVRGDDLPAGLDYALFDYAVNSGSARAAITLQTIVGVAPDGEVGPITLAATAKLPVKTLIVDLCSQRLAFLERLSTYPVFGRGWKKRVDGVRVLAMKMADQPAVGTPAPEPKPVKSDIRVRQHIQIIRAELDALEAAL